MRPADLPGRISAPSLPAPDATPWQITQWITSNPRGARAASVPDKARLVQVMMEEVERMEGQAGGALAKTLSPRQELRERCIETQMAAAILLETTLTDAAERRAMLDALPGLTEWLRVRREVFTSPRLRIIVERALGASVG